MNPLDVLITVVFVCLLLLAFCPTSKLKGRLRFKARRERNWFLLGTMYACYYLCRHNLGVANKSICDEFGFTRLEFGWIITAAFWAYAIGQFVNGFFCDRIGGKRSMLIGAIGTVTLNMLFGAASFWGILGTFIAIRLLDGYMQSMGAPGMIKINTAWFSRPERGGFAGIFGFMIQMGQVGIQRYLGPALLTGAFLSFTFQPMHWRYLFWVPSCITAFVAIIMALVVKRTPEEAGFEVVSRDENGKIYYEYPDSSQPDLQRAPVEPEEDVTPLPMLTALKTILSHRGVWFCAVAYFCTGFVRYGVLNWFLRFFEDYGIGPDHGLYLSAALWIAMAAVIGSLCAGFASDLFFKGRRAPVAAFLYLIETVIILTAAYLISNVDQSIDNGDVVLTSRTIQSDAAGNATRTVVDVFDRQGNALGMVPGMGLVVLFIVLVSFTCNSTHSIIGTAAAMDIGGRKMAGFSSGVIDSFQYIGGGLTGFFVGGLIDDYGYVIWMLSMAPVGIVGCVCMLIYRGQERKAVPSAAAPG